MAIAYTAAQIAAVALVAAAQALVNPAFNYYRWLERLDVDGLVVSVATFASAIACIPLLRFLVGRREPAPWTFLGVRPVSRRDILLSCGAIAIFVAIADTLTFLLGRPVVPPFMAEAWVTATSPALLCLAVIVAAPLVEELMFRGFLFAGLRACGAPVAVAALVISLLFAAIHAQYDLYDRTYVFLMSLMFVGARLRFDSVLAPIAMHASANAIATVETIVFTAG